MDSSSRYFGKRSTLLLRKALPTNHFKRQECRRWLGSIYNPASTSIRTRAYSRAFCQSWSENRHHYHNRARLRGYRTLVLSTLLIFLDSFLQKPNRLLPLHPSTDIGDYH